MDERNNLSAAPAGATVAGEKFAACVEDLERTRVLAARALTQRRVNV